MSLVITILLFTILGISILCLTPLGIITCVLSLCGLRKPMSMLTYKAVQGWAFLFIKLTGCRLTVKGQEHIPKTGGLCFVSNHGSIFDIIVLLALVGRPVGFISKKELAFIPVLNLWIFMIGGLFIDRKNIRKALRTINSGVERIKQGAAIFIFPEGTRSRGRGLLPFRSGSFKLASQSKAPILPVAITGTYDVFEKTHRVCRADVFVTFAPQITTLDLPHEDKRRNLAEQVHAIIAHALDEHEQIRQK